MFVKPHKMLFTLINENNDNSLLEDENIETIDYNSLIEITNIFESTVGDSDIPLVEAFVKTDNDLIKNFKQKIDSVKDLKNQWTKLSKNMITHKWITRYVTQDQENMINKYLNIMNEDNVSWSNYRKAFIQICRFFGLPNKGVIIEWLEFQDKKNEGRVAACRYSKGISRVNIPENVRLTHFSTEQGLTELNPSFKSKAKGKFFYDSPRVYFTIKEKLNPFKFGVDPKVKRICYQTVDYIPAAYIDPTYILFRDRCCYVECTKPIKVTAVGETSGHNILSGVKKYK